MPWLRTHVSCRVYDTFRVRQVAGMFDVAAPLRTGETFAVDAPDLTLPWQIGLITGPSGSGKSSVARRLFGTRLARRRPWPARRAIIDCLGEAPIQRLTGLLTAVGFGSPRAWIKPYRVLSGGEQLRCDLARELAAAPPRQDPHSPPPIVCFDEFASTIDRPSAQTACAALARAVRGGLLDVRLAAITCHADLADWLSPDWLLDLSTRQTCWPPLRPPPLGAAWGPCRRDAWQDFAPHHYLSPRLPPGVRCYAAQCGGQPAAFCAVLPLLGRQGRWRIARLVTRPQYQGLGLGLGLAEDVADLYAQRGLRMSITGRHPAVIGHCRRSPRWRVGRVKPAGSHAAGIAGYRGSAGRAVVTFEYIPAPSGEPRI